MCGFRQSVVLLKILFMQFGSSPIEKILWQFIFFDFVSLSSGEGLLLCSVHI